MIHFTYNCQTQQRHVAKQHGRTDVTMIVISCSFVIELEKWIGNSGAYEPTCFRLCC